MNPHTEVVFNHYSPYDASTDTTDSIIKCYQEVFATEPWNEWLRCPVCQKNWGKKDLPTLERLQFQHCNQKLVEYWHKETVRLDLFNEIQDNCSCWIAQVEDNVVGFCWGYSITVGNLIDKLKIDIVLPRDVIVGYQDEIGVISEWRGRGIAKELFRLRNNDFLAQNLTQGVVRTKKKPNPSITYHWYTRLGYRIVAQYPDSDGRVILIRTLQDLML
jgi:ribosomal protein S18 acetylase RimI-like enzyme